jgi:hypothetical protein
MAPKTPAGVAAYVICSSGFLPHLTAVGRPLAILFAVYYAIKTVVFLAASTVAMCTKDEKRRKACVELVRIVCRGWPRPPRLPGK